jgi:dienelactone hydrolase
MERRDDTLIRAKKRIGRPIQIQRLKDFKRCIDYLETRQDIDSNKLAYFGMSWGVEYGPMIAAVEDRLKVNVFLAGGLKWDRRPAANPLNYITRVKTPTLMMSGKYDTSFDLERSIKPMFDLLGTPDEHKELKLYETDHIPPRNEFIREILAWLDRYLGPVFR